MADRKKVEVRILNIISYIDQDKKLQPLIWSIKFFSLEELLQLLNFLETWDYTTIFLLLDKKIKEYMLIMKEIKQIKITNKMDKVKNNEKNEKEEEKKELEMLLQF